MHDDDDARLDSAELAELAADIAEEAAGARPPRPRYRWLAARVPARLRSDHALASSPTGTLGVIRAETMDLTDLAARLARARAVRDRRTVLSAARMLSAARLGPPPSPIYFELSDSIRLYLDAFRWNRIKTIEVDGADWRSARMWVMIEQAMGSCAAFLERSGVVVIDARSGDRLL